MSFLPHDMHKNCPLFVYVEGGGAFSDLTSKDTPGRLQEHGRLLERLRYLPLYMYVYTFTSSTVAVIAWFCSNFVAKQETVEALIMPTLSSLITE